MKASDKSAPSMMQKKLWEAASKGDSAMIRILAMGGVDLDAPNDEGFTAFSLATRNNHADAAMTILAAREMQYLRSIGADIKVKTGVNDTETARKQSA
jgi:ankyrin repeat protein